MSLSGPGANISIVVVDDHDLLREGVISVLTGFGDLEVVGEARNGETALSEVARLRPDVVVMDLVMPGMGGVEAIRQLRADNAELGIVALSSFSDSCLLYTSPSPRDATLSRMPSSA